MPTATIAFAPKTPINIKSMDRLIISKSEFKPEGIAIFKIFLLLSLE